MNEHYVNIKVDREERPDVDRLYMTFLQATSGGGGWPMSVCESLIAAGICTHVDKLQGLRLTCTHSSLEYVGEL